ncbi:hypothetical protein [Enterococcus faecium]|uniref:hypothetical protein n=1 Tax=Enterococcus faecium TaxID=1352 RepID=UPI000A3367BD|nr:hypothetical protein [Enterococcus faecium]
MFHIVILPVSYTHLDVYKRQEYGASAEETYKVAKNCIANIITLQTFCLKTEIVNEEQKETRYYSIN